MHQRTRVQWAAIGLPAALLGLFEFFRHRWLEHTLPGQWGNLIGAVVVAGAVYGFIRSFVDAVTRAEQDLGRTRAEAAVLAERQRIGREMHDSVAQALFHMRVRLQEVDNHLATGHMAAAREAIAGLDAQVGLAHEQVRRVISNLRQQAEVQDSTEALRRAATAAARDAGLTLALALQRVPKWDARGREHMAAVLAEAMHNARRHGQATAVQVTAEADRLVIADNGRGFDPNQTDGTGFGLIILAERAAILGGALQIDAAPGRGTRLILTWRSAAHADTHADR
jgi:signal transduction histidine kinase